MNVVIRPIEKKDYDGWKAIWSGPEDSYTAFDSGKYPMTEEVTNLTFSRFLDANEPVYSIVAERDGQIIGFANFVTHRSTWSAEDCLYINDLYVSQKNRLGGVGRKLMEYVYAECDRMNCGKCYWVTDFDNHAAQILYCKIGKKSGKLSYIRA